MKFTSVKVSNNALNFLLAQYRAIFKRAYVKGLASAVLLTAGLAAGAAQATNITDDNAATELADGKIVTINGGDTKLTISGNGTPITWDADVTVTSGAVATPDNYIQASGGNVSISGTGSLTINVGENDATTQGLAIKGGTGSTEYTTSVTMGKIDVVKGTLAIADGASGSTTVAAGSITIGAAPATGEDEGVVTQATDATQAYVNVTSSAKDVTFGATGSTITVNQGGQLSLSGSTGNLKVVGDTLALNNGAILLIDGTTSSIETTDLKIASGAVGVVKGSATGEFAGSNATVDGNLLVGTGATLNLTPASGDNGYGKVTVNGNAQIDGTVKLSQGTLEFNDGAQLHASGTAGGIQVTADSSKAGTLKITKSAFESFLGSGAKFDLIAEDGSVTADGGTSNKGGISLSGSSSTNATLEITGEGTVVLSDYTFSSGGTVSAGKIDVKSGTIAGNDLEVKTALTNAAGLHLRANTLRLGSTSYTSTGEDLNIAEAVAKDLILTSDNTGFGLKNSLTLDVTLNDTVTVSDANDDGTITGNPVLSDATKPLTIKHGNYTLSGDLTLSGGKLLVTNGNLAAPSNNIDTVLTLEDQDLNITSAGGTIEVNGSGATGVETILDISKVTLSFENGNSANAAINAYNDGTIRLKGEDLQTVIDSGLSSGAKVSISGGTIEVVDDLTIANTQIKNAGAAEASKIVFTDNTNGAGTLQVDGTLTINSVDNIKLGAQSQVSAGVLVLNSSSDAAAIISGGNFTALSSVGGDKGINVSGANASLALGAFEQVSDNVWSAKSSSCTIKTDLTVSNTGTLTVQNGSWKGANQSLTIAGGAFTVGDAAKVDASGNTFATSLTLNQITQSAGTSKIDTVGSVTTNSLEVSAGSFDISGSMTVNGLAAPQQGQQTDFGVKLTKDLVTLGNNAELSFGANATNAITVNETKDATDGWISIEANTFGAGDNSTSQVIEVGVGATVNFAFAEGTNFSTEALTELRKEIFGQETTLDGFVNLGSATLDGLTVENGEVAWSDLQGLIDVGDLADFTTQDLLTAKVTGITADAELRGSLGSLSSIELAAGDSIAVDGNLALNNAAGNNGAFASNTAGAILGLDVTENAQVNLNNGGEIGTVSFSSKGGSLVVASTGAATTIAAIDGAKAGTSFTAGTATVTGTTDTAQLTTAAGTQTTFTGVVTVGDKASGTDYAGKASSLAGASTFKAAATFAQDAVVESTGSADFASDVTFKGTASLYGDTTVDGTATAENGLTVDQGAVVAIDKLVTEGDVFIGSVEGEQAGAGTLSVTTLNLGGKNLVVDPAWDNATGLSFAGVDNFTTDNTVHTDAGVLDGGAYALQNAILSIGNSNKDEVVSIFGKFINAQGNLSNASDGVGSIVYVADTVEVATGGKIVADKTKTESTFKPADYTTDIFIGDNSVLGVEVSAATSTDASGVAQAAITFADNASVSASNSGKVVLTGDYDQSDRIFLFDDSDHNVTVSGAAITVETINGLLTYKYDGTQQSFEISDMTVDTKRAASAFSATSSPVHDSLVAYGTGNTDWRNDGKQTADEKQATKTHGAFVSGVAQGQDGHFYYTDDAGQITSTPVKDEDQLTTVNVLNPEYDPDNKKANAPSKYIEKVVYKAYNPLLSAINNVQANSGISAESAARMADFAGVAQVALKAGSSTSDAISGRMGMGAQNGAITYANNGQGAGLWVTPIYMNSDSDGFEAQGISYGTDINLYGVALGGDYTLANGIRVGAMFNVGSGDVDGQGAGSNVSSDFDYYGLGLYAGYTMGQFSIVGDISYTAVDNDLEANTEFAEIGKLETSLDSSNISFGVTGAYAFDTAAGVKVTPHVGLRYSYIDIDDYTVASKAGAIGSYSADSLSVFSIPVGVTIASEFNAGSWSVKPSFDVTLTGNFGDDENEGTFHWNGVENIDCGLTSEIFDNFTYGATLGVSAQNAAGISLGLSVGYTGSSNVDDLGVSANARFTF